MKRIVCSLLIVCVLFSALALSAFATSYSNNFTLNLENSMYNRALHNTSSGPVFVTYLRWVDTYWYFANATTSISVSTDATGRAFTQINGNNGEVITENNTTPVDGAISATAYTDNALYATKVGHNAIRRIGSVADSWEYWFYHSS